MPGVPFIALTATATRDTRVAIFDAMLMNEPCLIMESPNKENIAYIVEYMQKSTSLSSYFAWVADEIIAKKTASTRTIIYCQTIKQCAIVYSTLKTLLNENIYEDPVSRDPQRVLLEMLHSCTPSGNKNNILDSFQREDGCIRVLVATIAFGMGVDCKKVHQTIHFGPAKNVESYMQECGRAGRDGTPSTAYLLYQSLQLTHVEKDMKTYINSKECRRKFLLSFFDVQFSPKVPLHLCCDNCSLICKCNSADCKVLCYPTPSVGPSSGRMTSMQRVITTEQIQELKAKLYCFYKSLLIELLKRDSSGKLKVFNHPKYLLGFSDIQISQVITHAPKIFTIDDICNHIEIWDIKHAHKVYQIMQNVFGNMKGDNTYSDIDEISSDEDDLLPEDWDDLGVDEELAEMAIDELSFFQMNLSNDDSMDCSASDADVPFPAISALMNLSFDAVLDK